MNGNTAIYAQHCCTVQVTKAVTNGVIINYDVQYYKKSLVLLMY